MKVCTGILIYNDKNEILLVKGVKWKNKWVVPGGKINDGELAEDNVVREIKEELNIDVSNIEFCDINQIVNAKDFKEPQHFIFLRYFAKADSGDIKLNWEASEYKWIKPIDALELNLASGIDSFIEKFIQSSINK